MFLFVCSFISNKIRNIHKRFNLPILVFLLTFSTLNVNMGCLKSVAEPKTLSTTNSLVHINKKLKKVNSK